MNKHLRQLQLILTLALLFVFYFPTIGKSFEKNSATTHYFINHISASRLDTCPPNLNFELGNFNNWETNTGKVVVGPGPSNLISWNQPIWILNSGLQLRQEIIDRLNPNPALDPWGNFPVNPPNAGGRYSMRLGSDKNDPTSIPVLPNSLSDGIRYKVKVPSDVENYGIIFSYAVVFENPNHPLNIHTFEEQPRFIARFYEPGGDTISCANFTFVASEPLPGFDTSAYSKIDSASGRYPGGVNFAVVKYKPWSSVFVNLKKYLGKTLYLEFITTDCTKRGHFGYAYVDVLDCSTPISAEISCSGSESNYTILSGPPGFKKYEWWNKDYTIKIGESDSLKIGGLTENQKVNLILTPFDRFGCVDTLSTLIKVNTTATPGIRYPTLYTGLNTEIKLKARAIGNNYQWLPPTGLNNSNIIDPIFRSTKDIEYLIKILTKEDCLTTDTVNIKIEDGADFFIPEAFSPNDDGRNDRLDINIKNIKTFRFWIFNRWGQLMFETSNPNQKWDGRFNGKPQPLETYVWIAEGTSYTGKLIRRRGQTVLIR